MSLTVLLVYCFSIQMKTVFYMLNMTCRASEKPYKINVRSNTGSDYSRIVCYINDKRHEDTSRSSVAFARMPKANCTKNQWCFRCSDYRLLNYPATWCKEYHIGLVAFSKLVTIHLTVVPWICNLFDESSLYNLTDSIECGWLFGDSFTRYVSCESQLSRTINFESNCWAPRFCFFQWIYAALKSMVWTMSTKVIFSTSHHGHRLQTTVSLFTTIPKTTYDLRPTNVIWYLQSVHEWLVPCIK